MGDIRSRLMSTYTATWDVRPTPGCKLSYYETSDACSHDRDTANMYVLYLCTLIVAFLQVRFASISSCLLLQDLTSWLAFTAIAKS